MSLSMPNQNELLVYESLSKTLSQSSFFKKYAPADITLMFLVAHDLKLPPSIILAKGVNIIQGNVELSARTMNMLIRRAGHQIKIVRCTDVECVIWGKRSDTHEEMEVRYTLDDARKAGLIRANGGWDKNPSDMCFARAISRLARRLFPDCIGTFYIEGEISERKEKEPLPAPDLSDIEIEYIEPEEIKLEIPPEEDPAKVEEYLSLLTQELGYSLEYFKNRAKSNPEGFWESFYKWKDVA